MEDNSHEGTHVVQEVRRSVVQEVRRPVRPLTPLHFRQLVALHQSVNNSIARTQNDRTVIEQLSTECCSLQASLDAAISREMARDAELRQERKAHFLAREELAAKAKFELQTAESNAWLEQQVFQLHNAQAGLHQTLVTERQQHESTETELVKMQKWCHRVDSLVDVTRLEEDSKLELDDRSRHIGDIIMDIEYKLLKEYSACLKGKDDQIADLQRQLSARPIQHKPRKVPKSLRVSSGQKS